MLGDKGVNIDSFELSRLAKGKSAMALVKVDTKIVNEILESIKNIKYISNVRKICL